MTTEHYTEALHLLRDNLLKPMHDSIVKEGRATAEAESRKTAEQIQALATRLNDVAEGVAKDIAKAENQSRARVETMEVRLIEAVKTESAARRDAFINSLKSLKWD